MLTGSNAALGRALSHFWQQKHTDDLLNCPDETCWTSVDKAQRTVETFCPDLLINCPNFGDTGAERQKVPNIGCISRTAFLWEALRQSSFKTDKIILLSSGSIYEGIEKKGAPIGEEAPITSHTLEDLEILTVDLMAYQYFRAYKMPIVRLRLFDIFDGQSGMVLTRNYQPEEAEGGLDLTELQDLQRAIELAAELGKPGEIYNICSQQIVPNRILAEKFKLNPQPLYSDSLTFKSPGSCKKFINLTAWQPKVYNFQNYH